MSGLNIDPSKALVPFKSHKTLSNAEWKRRMEATYALLVRRLCKKAAAHFRAKIAWYKQMPEIEEDENKIDEWETLHREKPRLSKRLHPEVYPWEQRIAAKRYRQILHKRKAKLQLRMKRSELELEATRRRLKDELAIINSGLAWLMKQPAKISLKSNLLNGHPYERMADDQGRGGRIIIRNAVVERRSGAEHCDIVSIDPDEIIVSDIDECRSIRSLAGIRHPRLKKTDALLGDGIRQDNSFWLVGKTGDPGYLNSAIGYHFFCAGNGERSSESVVDFKTDEFLAHREEITNGYAGSATNFSLFEAVPVFNGGRTYYAVRDRNFLSHGQSARPKALHKRSFRSEPSFKGFYNSGDMISEGEIQSRYCNPSSWACYTEELRQALLMLDRGGSFIIDGAAGTGKTHMIPAMVNYCLAIGKSVKVMAGGDTLDVIETRCRAFMVDGQGHKFPMGWSREANYMIFGSTRDPRDYGDPRYDDNNETTFSSYLFMPPRHDEAGLLIFDDATRIPVDASLFSRRPQFVALGDFSQITCKKSIFAVARSSDLPTLLLRKNQRARNCDAVTWSNIFSYQNRLATPHRGARRSELRYVPLGRKRDGVVRAEVNAIINAARQALMKNETVGIVTFSQRQLEALRTAFETSDLTNLAFLGLPDEVQGREADCVLVSFNVALTPKGRLPLEIDGLEDEQHIEKMNVALSRSRQRTILFSSLLASDIDLRLATDAQALIKSVLQTFELLPSQQQMNLDLFYNSQPVYV